MRMSSASQCNADGLVLKQANKFTMYVRSGRVYKHRYIRDPRVEQYAV
jgi:hypothetical protein